MIAKWKNNVVDLAVGYDKIAKVSVGYDVVWENWKEYTGKLYQMTANTWNGFVASTNMYIWNGSDYVHAPYPKDVFDGNDATSVTTLNCNMGSRLRVDFPKSVKLRRLRLIMGATHSDEQVGTTWLTSTIYGVREDGTVDALVSHSSNNLYDTTPREFDVPIQYQDNLYKAIYIEKSDGYGWGQYRVYELQVIKWVQKGN